MKLQIFSDLHLEFGAIPVPQTDADVVIAAGDIHVQQQGIDWLKGFDQPVIYVAGNHEYWSGEYQQTLDQLKEACANSQIHFLERDSVVIQDVVFHGCTLWTDYADGNQWVMEEARERINDFKYIQQGAQGLSPQFLHQQCQLSQHWLQQQMTTYQGRQQIIVTHHAPSLHSWSRKHADMLKYAYCNQLDRQIQNDLNPAVWVHGHIHQAADYQLGETRVVCNPRGYHGLAERSDFDPQFCIQPFKTG